jgi:SAM-dependent methyltransferase
MKFRDDPTLEYLGLAPAALAFERAIEARLYRDVPLERPILDLGCGEGLFARLVFAEKIDTGIDPNARELERARELGGYEELIECAGDRIPKPDGHYRSVISNSVLEHIPQIEPVLREVHRILAPGGYFHFTVPSPDFERYNWTGTLLGAVGLDAPWRRFFNRFWAHHRAHDVAGWSGLAREAGFTVVQGHAYAPRRSCMLNTTLTPLALPAMLLKKMTNRWTLLPPLRRVLLAPLAWAGRRINRDAHTAARGGLVFMSVRKPG